MKTKRILAALLSMSLVFTSAVSSAGAADKLPETDINEYTVSESLLGDINCDGKTDITDLTELSLALVGDTALTEQQKKAADVDGDGDVKLADLAKYKQYLSKQIPSLSPADASEIRLIAGPEFGFARETAEKSTKDGYLGFVSDISDEVLLNTKDQKAGSNRIYSPVSVYMAASMLAECCEGQSLEELYAILDVNDKEQLRNINRNLFKSLYSSEDNGYCMIANSVWGTDRYVFEEDVLNILADDYFASSSRGDLGSKEYCDSISEWIYQNTSEKFRPEINPDQLGVLKLINTVTFKEGWSEGFEYTYDNTFFTAEGETECKFMSGEFYGEITEDSRYKKLTKDFTNNYKMNFVLPAEDETPESLLSDSEIMNRIVSDSKGSMKTKVSAIVPEFSSESKFDLIQTFKALGAEKIFMDLDIEPLIKKSKNPLLNSTLIDQIDHEAVIDVNKDGCEAAAYTVISVTDECCGYMFKLDRPFIYYISDAEGVPVFVGIVNNPTEK